MPVIADFGVSVLRETSTFEHLDQSSVIMAPGIKLAAGQFAFFFFFLM